MTKSINKPRILEALEPQKVFYYFEEITRIPHGSENEKAISDYVVKMAQELSYEVEQDESYNVSVIIPATAGYEDKQIITLQSHLDMVCQKEAGVDFDFATQPLDIYIENGFIHARGTTLGADDGFGVAMMLAIMNSPELEHAPLQLLFTTAEEIFLVGARAMSDELIKGRYLIGLDCAFDDAIIVSCAGISISRAILPTNRQPYDHENSTLINININGLTGGHSGNTIHHCRANAIKLLGELLSSLQKEAPFRIVKLQGGTVINAIPAQAAVQIVCTTTDIPKIQATLAQKAEQITRTFARTDSKLHIEYDVEQPAAGATAYDEEQTGKAIQLINLLDSGFRSLIDDKFTSAECSCNLAILQETENDLQIRLAIRSNSEYHHDVQLDKYRMVTSLVGADYMLEQRLAAWEYKPNSPLELKAAELFAEVNGHAPIIKKIHATVEAVAFVGKMNNRNLPIDIINIGCNNLEPHTPQERLEIASVGRTYKLLTKLIKAMD